MIKEISPDQLNEEMKKAFDGWQAYFAESVNALSFIPYMDYQGEDKNMLALRSKHEFISWFSQAPGTKGQPWRDECFYTRELTWLSMWCQPRTVVEFGTDKGIGTFILSRVNPQAVIHTVDNAARVPLPNGTHIETGMFALENQMNIIINQSNSSEFVCEGVDLCFIDGDHSQDAVWKDSLRAFENRNKAGRWVIIWHDYRDSDEMRGLKMAVTKFSDLVRKRVYKFNDSATVWMSSEP